MAASDGAESRSFQGLDSRRGNDEARAGRIARWDGAAPARVVLRGGRGRKGGKAAGESVRWPASHNGDSSYASAHNVQIIEDGCDNNQQKVENGHHDSDSDSDASVKLQRNSAVVHSSGFGGHAQDNANAKMLSSITEIEIRNFSAPFGDACPEKHKVPSIPEESETTQTELQVLESYPIKHSLVSQTCGQCFLQIDPSILGKPKHGDESEWDSLIFLAANTLVSISSHKTECVTYHSSGLRQIEAEEIEEPQYSSDSFETLTMGLPEITSDKYTMPAIPSKKVSGNDACKLRRGKGLRDFQKDILLCLASLSSKHVNLRKIFTI
ncbi:hypothetical protein J5N97_029865 [Dioscorea zingiberensis]|uniref:Uncharacterized protein n=1 Tax=Dioscorea zingiberensis TaxID=325984 RepID=A0A9D5BWN3_9LILI|nr:hypothetical protein J5N97_029865 [Dioscorea zingiberensis]